MSRSSPNPAPNGPPRTPASPRVGLGLVVLTVLAAAGLRLCVGPGGFGVPTDPASWEIRLARIAAAAVAGGSLGLAGVLLQGLLRNPLASPDIMGISSGSGLAVLLAAWGAQAGFWPENVPAPAAFAGALATLGLVFAFSQRRGRVDHATLALVGVSVGLVCAAAGVLVQQALLDRGVWVSRWLLGGIHDEHSATELTISGLILFAGTAWAMMLSRSMDTATLGDDAAASVGVGLVRLRLSQFVLSGSLSATAVLIAGPLGFVGLIGPHVARLLVGPRHGVLLVSAAGLGASLVLVADTMIRLVDVGTGRLPLGAVTGLIGAPFLIWLLRSRGRMLPG